MEIERQTAGLPEPAGPRVEASEEVVAAVLTERHRCCDIVIRTPIDFNWSIPRIRHAIKDAILTDEELLGVDGV